MRSRKLLAHAIAAVEWGAKGSALGFGAALTALMAGAFVRFTYGIALSVTAAWSIELTIITWICFVGFVAGVVSYIRALK